MERRLRNVAILHIVISVVGPLLTYLAFVLVAAVWTLVHADGAAGAHAVPSWLPPPWTTLVAWAAIGLMALSWLYPLPAILAAAGLMRGRRWARVVFVAGSVLQLLDVPFGTVVGVYSLWVLRHRDTAAFFRQPPPADPAGEVRTVSDLHLTLSVLGVVHTALVTVPLLIVGIGGGIEHWSGWPAAVGFGLVRFSMLYIVPGVFGAVGLLGHFGWARRTILVGSVLQLANVPIGTAVGAYSLWVLRKPDVVQLFSRAEQPSVSAR